jgi:hypothetical protein
MSQPAWRTLSRAPARSYLDVPSFSVADDFVPECIRVPSRLSMTALAPDDVLSWTDVVLRLLAATGIGGAIGLNRELTRKPAGLRTHALVALGSALATVSALTLGDPVGASHGDAASRVIQGIVAGIGFIGGGVILHTEHSPHGRPERGRPHDSRDDLGCGGARDFLRCWSVARCGIRGRDRARGARGGSPRGGRVAQDQGGREDRREPGGREPGTGNREQCLPVGRQVGLTGRSSGGAK